MAELLLSRTFAELRRGVERQLCLGAQLCACRADSGEHLNLVVGQVGGHNGTWRHMGAWVRVCMGAGTGTWRAQWLHDWSTSTSLWWARCGIWST